MIRKMIYSILLLGTSLFSKPLDSYFIDLKQIDNISYIGNERIIVKIKEEYWQDVFEFTRSRVSQKVSMKIDTISMEPYIVSPLYDSLELSPVNPEEFSKNLKKILNKPIIKNEESLNKKKNIFLNKMLKKYVDDDFIRVELIKLYHSKETPKASRECIALYENTTEEMKKKIIEYNYNNILDCYLDLNNTTKAFELLTYVKKNTKENELYVLLELEGYLYTQINEPKNAKKFYTKALETLKKTDLLKAIKKPDKMIIEQINEIKKSDIKRLEEIISKIELKLLHPNED